MPDPIVPEDYNRVRIVNSFDELIATPFSGEVNALCWPRTLRGDFHELAHALPRGEDVEPIDENLLESLTLSTAGKIAVMEIQNDLRLLQEQGRDPILNRIEAYPRDETPGAVATDVMSFHADSAPIEADTWLCTYHGACSEGLRNDQATRYIEVPETRAALLREFGGEDDASFLDFLADHCYDLHYAPLPGAQPFSFGLGALWRIAIEHPTSLVPPCIHRAPDTRPGDPPRLLLIC